jgi:hypothetical protein
VYNHCVWYTIRAHWIFCSNCHSFSKIPIPSPQARSLQKRARFLCTKRADSLPLCLSSFFLQSLFSESRIPFSVKTLLLFVGGHLKTLLFVSRLVKPRFPKLTLVMLFFFLVFVFCLFTLSVWQLRKVNEFQNLNFLCFSKPRAWQSDLNFLRKKSEESCLLIRRK